LKRHYILGLFVSVLGLSASLHAQAVPTASRPIRLQVGAGFTFATPDYGQSKIQGFTGFADLDLKHRLGIELEYHDISIITPTDIGENTLLLGLRYSLYRKGRINAYAKGLGGLGWFSYQDGTYHYDQHTDTFGAYAIGGGVEIKATEHINVRAFDFEAQKWPGYFTPGFPNTGGISPYVSTFGVAYVR
jgi:Outer membrane protein beta-barrel domain